MDNRDSLLCDGDLRKYHTIKENTVPEQESILRRILLKTQIYQLRLKQ